MSGYSPEEVRMRDISRRMRMLADYYALGLIHPEPRTAQTKDDALCIDCGWWICQCNIKSKDN